MKRRSLCAAFSLPELLSACAVTLVILLLGLQALSSSARVCQSSAELTSVAGEGRTLIDLISRDLDAALVSDDTVPTFSLRPATGTGEPDQLCFFATFPHRSSGDLCLIGYRMEWDAATRSYRLLRSFLDNAALLRLMESTVAEVTPDMVFSAPEAISEVAAEGLWGFALRPGSEGSEEAFTTKPLSAERMPEWVSIRFKVIGPKAMQRLATLSVTREDWGNDRSTLYRDWIAPFAQSFYTRVRLLPQGSHLPTFDAGE